jgi:hypothetical protein
VHVEDLIGIRLVEIGIPNPLKQISLFDEAIGGLGK